MPAKYATVCHEPRPLASPLGQAPFRPRNILMRLIAATTPPGVDPANRRGTLLRDLRTDPRLKLQDSDNVTGEVGFQQAEGVMDTALDLIGTHPLRRAAYTDAALFQSEQKMVFAGGWTALLFDHQLPDIGDQVPVEAAGLPLVAVRDRNGNIRVFHNVCRHRASLVVPAPVKGQPTLRCPYHGWAYGLDGGLRATPLWDGRRVPNPAALDRAQLGLREVRCGVWSDVVWIDLSGTAPALDDHVAPLTRLWHNYDMTTLRLAHYETGQIAANWKLAIEASIENYHEPFVHEKLPARLELGAADVRGSGAGCDVRLRDAGGCGAAQRYTFGAVTRPHGKTQR